MFTRNLFVVTVAVNLLKTAIHIDHMVASVIGGLTKLANFANMPCDTCGKKRLISTVIKRVNCFGNVFFN